jgi:8-oxo-dGTP diphosphatase
MTIRMLTRYVLGFIFDTDGREVVLIEKRRPAWQAGLLNGIGGKIEAGETALEAMQRECREECGLTAFREPFRHFGRMSGPDFEVELFTARAANPHLARSCTDETVRVVPVSTVSWPGCALPNVAPLLSLARAPQSPWVELVYK